MKKGDIVKVTDGSWNLAYLGKDSLTHIDGNGLAGRLWKVVSSDLGWPTDEPGRRFGEGNDLMLVEVGFPEHVLFTQSRFCTPIDRPCVKTVYVRVPADSSDVRYEVVREK